MTVRLVDQVICAASEAWRDAGEVLATGIGLVPRLAASLAMRSSNPDLMMTDSEAWIVSEPVPVGPRGDYEIRAETWMGFSRIFSNVWGGKRHAMVGPTQIDRFAQANISCIGDYAAPKVQMLGVRGFPGNSISHPNSFFVPAHSRRVFVDGEVDMVSSIGFNPARLPRGYSLDDIAIGRVVSNLGVFDFGGPDRQFRLLSLHAGASVDAVVENTGFAVHIDDDVAATPEPTDEQLALLAELDPHDLRARALG
jgi:glutaconate CoA-transferase subunit B